MNDDIVEIINRLDQILIHTDDITPDVIGSYIVGATIVRDDIQVYYKQYPLLEEIAEQGADLETLGDSSQAVILLEKIKSSFISLKNIIQEDSTDN